MEDRFKIRAFDISDNCYVKITHLDFDTNGNISQMKFVKLTNMGSDGEYICNQDQLDKFIFEQFVGFRDINGKLIYEGDILGDAHSDEPRRCSQVLYDKKDSQFKTFSRFDELEVEDTLDNLLQNDRKIVGNIHENPELLE